MSEQNKEPVKKDYSITGFAKEALHDLVHFDAKFLNTLKPLIAKPGFLTTEAFTPAQTNYVKPLALFVFINFIFFIFKSKGLFHYTLEVYNSINFFKQAIAASIASSHLPAAIFTERFNTSMKFEQQEYVIIMIPLFALFIHLFYLNKKQSYAAHLIFSLHFYSFAIIFLMVFPYAAMLINYLISVCGSNINILNKEIVLDAILIITIGVYLFFALKRVYNQSKIITIFKTLLSSAFFFFLIVFVYRFLLFYVVMHSVSE